MRDGLDMLRRAESGVVGMVVEEEERRVAPADLRRRRLCTPRHDLPCLSTTAAAAAAGTPHRWERGHDGRQEETAPRWPGSPRLPQPAQRPRRCAVLA